jgi:hypothetical protein
LVSFTKALSGDAQAASILPGTDVNANRHGATLNIDPNVKLSYEGTINPGASDKIPLIKFRKSDGTGLDLKSADLEWRGGGFINYNDSRTAVWTKDFIDFHSHGGGSGTSNQGFSVCAPTAMKHDTPHKFRMIIDTSVPNETTIFYEIWYIDNVGHVFYAWYHLALNEKLGNFYFSQWQGTKVTWIVKKNFG